jgi:hypothetical protein
MQSAAIQTMVSQGLRDVDAFTKGFAKLTDIPLSDALVHRIKRVNETEKNLMIFLCQDLESVTFDGPMGLKDRTGLGDFRYDVL